MLRVAIRFIAKLLAFPWAGLTNLFLFNYKDTFLRDNLCKAKWFRHTISYIDDLLTLIPCLKE